MNPKTKRMLSGAGAIVVALALLIGGTYAYTAFEHKTNPFRNAPDYQGRLVEDFEEKEWEQDEAIKKHISVRNMGGTQDFPGKNWGDIYARVKLKEHMDISPIDYNYYPKESPTNKTRFMVDKQGRFVKFEATGTNNTINTAQLNDIRNSPLWNEVINDGQMRDAFRAALVPANFIRLKGFFDTQEYWYLVTKENDPNGQYGAFVVVERTVDYSRMEKITGSTRAAGIDYGSGLLIRDPSVHDNEECLYPVHYWDEVEPWECDLATHEYVTWQLGDSRTGGDSWILVDDWDGNAIDKWILNPETGWATWGDAIKPGDYTALLLESVTPIKMPDGEFLYVIHADMQCTDRFDMLKPDFWKDGDGEDDPWDIENIVGKKETPASGVSIDGGDRTMEVGDEDQLKARVRPSGATNKNVKWRSSDDSVVTVDDDGNIVAVGEGTAVITVTTEDGDFEDEITITVVPGTVPGTGITLINGNTMTIQVGQTKTIDYTVVPSNSTDTATLSSNNGNVSIVSNTQIKGEVVGTSIVTIRLNATVSTTVTVTVVAATVPATDINITTSSPMTIEVGQTLPINYTVVPSNSTDTASLSSSNGNVSIVSSTQIKGEAVGTSVVTVTAGGISKQINVTVVAATPGTLTIDVGAAGIEIVQGQEMDIPYTIAPPNTNYVLQWTTTPGTGSVTIVNQDGRIRGATVGTATVTLTVGSKSATVNVTVIPAADPTLPLLGSGIYDMVSNDSFALNYSVVYDIDERDFYNAPKVQDGSVRLSDILSPSFTDYSSLSITSPDSAVASKVSIGKDKGDYVPGTMPIQYTNPQDAIIVSYYGTPEQWAATRGIYPKIYPAVQITLVLSAPGYQDATIKINLAFTGSLY